MAVDPYLKVRCGVCGVEWYTLDGKPNHPPGLSCSQYMPERVDPSNVDDAIAVNMPGKYDPRHLRRNPADTTRHSPSFRIPKPQPADAVKATDVQPSMNGKHE